MIEEVKKNIAGKKFLVTGGAGFIGSNIVEYLLAHNAGLVRIIDNFTTGYRHNIEPFLAHPNFELIEGDIRDEATCEQSVAGVDAVLHQAALNSVPRSIDNPIATNDVNIRGTLNLLHACVKMKVKRFVFASSSSVYGDSPKMPKVENETGRPLSPYAVTKVTKEHYAKVFSDIYGLETIGLRYFNIFGKNQNPDGDYAAFLPKLLKAALHDTPITIFGDGEQGRDFTFIDNAVQANVLAALTQNPAALNRAYNVAVGDRTTLNELVMVTEKAAGKKIDVKYGPPRAGDVKNSLADISAAKELLGYRPSVRITDGMQEAYSWFATKFVIQKN